MTETRVLLDTSVVIAPPAAGLSTLGDLLAVSAISVAELEYGAYDEPDPLQAHARRQRLDATTNTFDILDFDRATAQRYGLLANMVRAAGCNPRPRRLDLLIAATAARHNLALATRNPDDLRDLERALTVIPVED